MTRLIYILAASHSGSTLLAMLLGAHRDAITVGELKATSLGNVDEYKCSCGTLLKQCGFWRSVCSGMEARGFSFSPVDAKTDYRSGGTSFTRRLLRPLHHGSVLEGVRDAALSLSPDWRRRLPELQRRNAALIESVCHVSGAKAVVDSSKVALRLKYLLQIPELEVSVVRLVRDGRAVALTYMDPDRFASTQEMRAKSNGQSRVMSMEAAADQWRRANGEAEYVLAGLDRARWIQVNYEQYCRDPDSVLREVFEFLKLDPVGASKDFRARESHIIGNSMRLDTSSEVTLDERWRDVLTADELSVFDRVAGRMNRAYGYD